MSAPSIRFATSTGDPDRVRVAAAPRLQDEVGSDEPVLLLGFGGSLEY